MLVPPFFFWIGDISSPCTNRVWENWERLVWESWDVISQKRKKMNDWKAATAPDGRTYYYNILTKETTWNNPLPVHK